jgi:membrane associated rhomboid family serine protease
VLLLVYLWQYFLGEAARSLVMTHGLIPARLFSSTSWDLLGPSDQLMPLFSYLFLHDGWLHVLSNFWWLLIFGAGVESRIGSLRCLFFFTIAGVAAGLGHGLVHPEAVVPLIGASGSVSGIMGAYLYLAPRAGVDTILLPIPVKVRVHAWVFLALWMLLQIAFALLALGRETPLAFWAHLVGFGFGLASAWVSEGLFGRQHSMEEHQPSPEGRSRLRREVSP